MNFSAALNKLWAKTPLLTRDAIIAIAADTFHKFRMEDELVIAHFMAQISHESRCGMIRREDMRYRADRIMEIFGVGKHSAKVTQYEARMLAGKPEELAERVYGLGNPKKAKELGNTRPGDGFRYRGNGFLQLTGRRSHRDIGELIGVDLEANPELLKDPKISFMAAVAEFARLKCIPAAKADNVVLVTKRVNGGRNGLADRQVWLRKWKECLDTLDAPEMAPRFAEVDTTPSLLGTRTGQISTITGGAAVVSTVSQVGDYASSVTDTVSVVKDSGVQVVETVRVVKPFLGLSAHTWMQIGIGASVAVIIGVIAIAIYRHLKIKHQGV